MPRHYSRIKPRSTADDIREQLGLGLSPKAVADLLNLHVDRVYRVQAVDRRRARIAAGGPAVVVPKNEQQAMCADLRLIVRAIKREFHDESQRAHLVHPRRPVGDR